MNEFALADRKNVRYCLSECLDVDVIVDAGGERRVTRSQTGRLLLMFYGPLHETLRLSIDKLSITLRPTIHVKGLTEARSPAHFAQGLTKGRGVHPVW